MAASAPTGSEMSTVSSAIFTLIQKPIIISRSFTITFHQRSDRPCGGKLR